MNKQEKQQAVAALKEKFRKAKGMVITDYTGMTVAEVSELRKLLRGSGVEYKVVKNTLARIALADTSLEPARSSLKGPVGVAISYDDAVAAPKGILEFAKTNQKLKVTGGVVEGALCAPAELKSIAALPPRQVMLGMLAGTVQAPLSKMASLLSATVSSFAYALDAVKRKKEAQA